MKNKDSFLHQLKLENQTVQNGLMSLMESFGAVSSTLELDEVLEKIMHFALNIVKTAEAGYIQLYDEHLNKLIVKSYVGFNDNIKLFKVNVGQSITGKVFRDGSFKMISTKKEIYENMFDLDKENLNYIEKANPSKNINSILSVPVTFGNKRIGVMTLHCFSKNDNMSETELLLLQSFATQAAIALHNAQMHKEVQKSLDEVTHLSTELKAANTLLAKRTDIHNLLTRLSIRNGGLDTIIIEMNKLMKKKLVYADFLEGKCYPSHNPQFEKNIGDLFLLFTNKTEPAYVSIFDTVEMNCYVYPIRSGSIFLGCLIVEANSSLSQTDRLTTEHGAPVISLEIMKIRSQTEIMYKKTYETYHQFLKIKNPHQAEVATKDLGIQHHHFLKTVLIELDGSTDLQSLENAALLLLTHLKKKVPMDNGLLFSYNNKITLFSSDLNTECKDSFKEMIQNCMKWLNERYGVTARAGISTGHYYPGQAEENHLKAEKALLHLKKQNKKGVLHYKDIGISSLFLYHHPEEIEVFLNETFSRLWTERDKNNELLHTLITYVQNNRSMTATAKDFYIHTNTLYHRIKKIEEILKMDFNSYEDYLKVQLAVYLYKTYYN